MILRLKFLSVFVLVGFVSSYALPSGYILQNVAENVYEYNCVHQKTGKVVDISGFLMAQELEHKKELPCSKESFADYLEQYLKSNQASLDYSSDFWEPVRTSSAALEFSCLKDIDFCLWFAKVEGFCLMLAADNHRFFKSKVISKYFKAWRETFERLKKEIGPDNPRIPLLSAKLNSLVSIVNNSKTFISWLF